ncbi:HU family DNA-binding protein [Sinimarinibacterium flocculans]|uniref:DNA-binding protein HU-beta n=1 Tax=Sinimarinibacterium flocculans TaxID=985250 RepID=A0A318ECE1_9GAMM|nr:HU family DNA-binding protein [Sinimarinibacterium flocculans]PXV67662.1 DNA-binding protein HU-beta [Sinimarinibacterium flocculans]
MSDTLSTAALIEEIAAKTGLAKSQVKAVLQAEHDAVIKAVKKSRRVSISGFGIFTLRKRAARKGRNPQTGETVKIKASKSIAFKAAKAAKDSL